MSLTGSIARDLPSAPALRVSALAYLAHVLCQGWIGSSEGFLGIAIIAAAVAWRRGELRLAPHPVLVPLILYAAASILSALASYRPAVSLANTGEWFPFLALPLAMSLYAATPALRRLGLRAMALLAVFQSSYGLAQYFLLGRRELESRITGTTAHVMTYSGILLPLAILMLSLALSRLRTPWILLAAVVCSLAIAFTFTRGAWLGWLAGSLLLALLRRPRSIAWAIPVALLAVSFSPLPLFARFVSSFDTSQPSVLDRIRMTQAGVEIIRDNPLLGVGPSNIKEIYPLYRHPDAPRFRIPHLHSNPVQIWAERGVAAFGAWLLLLGLYAGAMIRARKRTEADGWADGGLAAVAALTVAGLFEFNFGDTEVLLMMLDIMALTLAATAVAPALPAAPEAGESGAGIPVPAAG